MSQNNNLCSSGKSFNVAVKKAVDEIDKKAVEKIKPWAYVYAVIWMIFFVWALLLAMSLPKGPGRVVHLTLAMVFSPLYVLAYYFGALEVEDTLRI
jgi:hypothetical protein